MIKLIEDVILNKVFKIVIDYKIILYWFVENKVFFIVLEGKDILGSVKIIL